MSKATNTSRYSHLEQFALEPDGIKFAIEQVDGIINELKAGTQNTFSLQVKGEGAPGFVAGIDPEDKKFFVAYKQAVSRDLPLMKTAQDVKNVYSDNAKLLGTFTELLRKLPKVIKSGFYGGDVLFSSSTPKTMKNVGNNVYVTFKPNTLKFGIIADKDSSIVTADIGVMIHTKFSGNKVNGATGSFNVDVDNDKSLSNSSNVFVTDGQAKRVFSNAIEIENSKINSIRLKLNTLKGLSRTISKDDYADLKPIITKIEPFVNSKVKSNDPEALKKSNNFINDLLDLGGVSAKQKKILDESSNRKNQLRKIIISYIILYQIKQLMVQSLNKLDQKIDVFDSSGKTNPEGYLIVDKKNNSVVKLIDRFNFSRINFEAHK